jgi:hypothetical protein
MLRSFLLRISQILSLTATISLFLMTATLGIQKETASMYFTGTLFIILLLWWTGNSYVIKKVDPELSMEVARLLFPAGAILSLCLSIFMAIYLAAMIPGDEGKQHLIIPFVGIGIALFLIVRCFDIKWLRGEEEIIEMEAGLSE